jgi:hypothetical protein
MRPIPMPSNCRLSAAPRCPEPACGNGHRHDKPSRRPDHPFISPTSGHENEQKWCHEPSGGESENATSNNDECPFHESSPVRLSSALRRALGHPDSVHENGMLEQAMKAHQYDSTISDHRAAHAI